MIEECGYRDQITGVCYYDATDLYGKSCPHRTVSDCPVHNEKVAEANDIHPPAVTPPVIIQVTTIVQITDGKTTVMLYHGNYQLLRLKHSDEDIFKMVRNGEVLTLEEKGM
jgi:hypothetical protein